MIRCKEIPREFQSLKAMYQALKINKQQLIDKKKSAIKFTDDVSFHIIGSAEETKGEVKELATGDYVYPVINTTNYLDSHGDVHLNGIWDKSVTDQKGKIYYIVNHDLSLGKVISYPDEVEMMLKMMDWKELGKNYAGQTQALVFKAKLTDSSNDDAFKAFKNNRPIQNSVRMVYVTLDLAINDGSSDFKNEKRNWDKYYPLIANKEVADERGYFWPIMEAKIYKEGSAVLFGSNDATNIQYEEPKHIEPLQSTHKTKPANSQLMVELRKLESITKKITK